MAWILYFDVHTEVLSPKQRNQFYSWKTEFLWFVCILTLMDPNICLFLSSVITLPWNKSRNIYHKTWNKDEMNKYNKKNALERLQIVANIFDTANHLSNLNAIKITLVLWVSRRHHSQLILEAYFQPPALWRIMCLSAHIKAWWIARLYSRNQTWSSKEATVFSGKYNAFSISEAFTNNTP